MCVTHVWRFFVALYGVWLLFGQSSLFSTWWRLVTEIWRVSYDFNLCRRDRNCLNKSPMFCAVIASLSNILCCIVQGLDIDEFQSSSRSYLPWTFFHAKLPVNQHRCGVYPPLDISFPRVSWVFHIFLYVYPRITRVSPRGFPRCWALGRSRRHRGGWQHCGADHHPSAAGKCLGTGWVISAHLCQIYVILYSCIYTVYIYISCMVYVFVYVYVYCIRYTVYCIHVCIYIDIYMYKCASM